jgi:hypothetical protein
MVSLPSSPPPDVPGSLDRSGKIVVRRFAGHACYAEQLDEPILVAHLTDQHVGRVTPMEMQLEAVACTNDNAPDLVCISGDFVCHSQAYLEDLTEVIRGFTAPVVCVLGNHDHWCGAPDVVRSLVRAGACVLSNSMTTVEVRHQRLQIVGLNDAYTGHADAARATRAIKKNLPVLALSHIAEEADHLWQLGVPLVLSGHTHAGQVTVARLHELSIGKLAGHRYVHGLYGDRRGDGAVYVGAGIGAAMVPFRIGERAQREVALFDLGLAPGDLVEHHEEQPPLSGRKPSQKTQLKRHAAVAKKAAKREAKARRRVHKTASARPRR